MADLFDFRQRLDIAEDADERTIRRAYARELKLIDQERDPAGFQSLREAYDAALFWTRHHDQLQVVRQHDADAAGDSADADAEAPVSAAAPAVAERTAPHSPTFEFAPPAQMAAARQDPEHDAGADHTALAGAVFSEFLERCKGIADEPTITCDAPWEHELRRSLADARLISIAARDIYERHIAQLLAEGWQPGHEGLLLAAVNVFDWGNDRRRVLSLGSAGALLDTAIEQRAMFDMQPDALRDAQQRLIERLRNPREPGTRELVVHAATLETLIVRFPQWLALMASVPTIVDWRERSGQVPQWRRKLTFTGLRRPKEESYEKQGSSFNWGWLIFVAILGLGRIASNASHDTNRQAAAMADVSHLIDIGDQQLNEGDTAKAIVAYDGAIERDPVNALAYAGRGMAMYELDDYARATQDTEKALSLNKSSPRAYRVRGLLAMKDARYSDALADFTRSIQLNPDNPYTYYQRGLAYQADHQYGAARTDAEHVIRLRSIYMPGAYLLLARTYKEQGDKAKAAEQAEALITALPNVSNAYLIAARIYTQVEQPAAALEAVDRGIGAAPHIRLHIYRAELLPAADIAGRRTSIQAALAMNPREPEALLLLGGLEYDVRNYQAAIDTYTSILASVPAGSTDRIDPLLGRGVAYAKLGKTSAAESDLSAAQGAATQSGVLNNICWYLAIRNVSLHSALESCDAALAISPNMAFALDSKGFVLLRLGRYQEAIAAYDAALMQRPTLANSLFGRGIAKRRHGDRQGGDADMRAALAIAADIAKIYAGYGITP